MNTSLFRVSKTVSLEAQDVFFDTHTVIIFSAEQINGRSKCFRHIEFRSTEESLIWMSYSSQSNSANVKTIVAKEDDLAPSLWWIRSCSTDSYGTRFQWVGIGHVKVTWNGSDEKRMLLQLSRFCRWFPKAKQLACELSLTKLFDEFRVEQRRLMCTRCPGVLWLVLWLATYDKSRVCQAGGVLSAEQMPVLEMWHTIFSLQDSAHPAQEGLPEGVKIWDLNVVQHGEAIVERATNLISLNVLQMKC